MPLVPSIPLVPLIPGGPGGPLIIVEALCISSGVEPIVAVSNSPPLQLFLDIKFKSNIGPLLLGSSHLVLISSANALSDGYFV